MTIEEMKAKGYKHYTAIMVLNNMGLPPAQISALLATE